MLPLNRYSIEYKKDYIYYDFVKDLINYYEKNDVIKIPFSNPNFILMSCSSKDILNKVLSQDNFPKEVYIDDDKGRIVPVEKFTAWVFTLIIK